MKKTVDRFLTALDRFLTAFKFDDPNMFLKNVMERNNYVITCQPARCSISAAQIAVEYSGFEGIEISALSTVRSLDLFSRVLNIQKHTEKTENTKKAFDTTCPWRGPRLGIGV